MNFFEHQDIARRNTRRLVLLMLAAVLSLIAVTTVLLAVVLYYFEYSNDPQQMGGNVVGAAFQTLSWEIVGYVALGVGIVVALGSAFKLMQLSSGGRTVAEAMGGRLINLDTRNADERKILNVVEEMAIASGTPVPPVYVIEDESINAFAAGFQPQDAVIGITRGSIRILSREELQGVIAHEFSHILHGDMRLNIRLVGILHGILLLGLIGYFLLRTAHVGAYSSSRRRGNNALPMLAMGLGLMIIGYAGTFFGNLIKAAVSRQREFLADASAVQFTRNPDGIAGALKKIGGYAQGSMLQSPRAAEFSHMYFGQGVKAGFSALMATHPPLQERISRIEPRWDGRFPAVEGTAQQTNAPGAERPRQEAVSGLAAAAPLSAVESIGQPGPEHVEHAHNLIEGIDPELRDAAHDPFSARAVVYSLLMQRSDSAILERQWQQLQQQAHPVTYQFTGKVYTRVGELARAQHLPLLELCIPALKAMSTPQQEVFKRNLQSLIRADEKVELFEWSLYRIVMHNLEPSETKEQNSSLKELSDECQLVLSMVAHSGHPNRSQAESAYQQGFSQLGLSSRFFLNRDAIHLPDLDRALARLRGLKPLQKPALLKAIAACIEYDAQVTVTEAELFRAIADSLDCPVPPLLAEQKLA
ncbi:M48 family metallopeptidase [Gilvimarinus sp. F26214L]|uniref:M48 family metallopeptidase n=1 Tax=Gilvimarinus sp. DZF01 TaxID=3461371 RepID=UPI004045A7F1